MNFLSRWPGSEQIYNSSDDGLKGDYEVRSNFRGKYLCCECFNKFLYLSLAPPAGIYKADVVE